MKLKRIVGDIAEATAFLTRYRLPDGLFNGTASGASAAWAFPLAGAFAVAPAVLVLVAVHGLGGSALLAAILAILMASLTTGALHEDGLADCADGLIGGKTRDDALRIMKDSRLGSYGVLALIFATAIKVAAVAEIAETGSSGLAVFAILATAICARAAMVWHWHFLPPAKKDGAAAALGQPGSDVTMIAVAALPFCLLAVGLAFGIAGQLFAAFVVMGLCCSLFSRLVRSRIDGHTGDTIGASEQIAEMSFLATLAILT